MAVGWDHCARRALKGCGRRVVGVASGAAALVDEPHHVGATKTDAAASDADLWKPSALAKRVDRPLREIQVLACLSARPKAICIIKSHGVRPPLAKVCRNISGRF